MNENSQRRDARSVGMDETRLSRVVEAFERQCARGVFPGGQLAVRRRGVLVVDEVVGIARGVRAAEGEPPTPFTPATQSCVFSAGKPLTGIAVAMLEDRGLIDVDAPVGAYWPEFARDGKENIRVIDVLTHRSGLFLRDIEHDWRSWGDWDAIVQRIAEARPTFPLGTLAYQPQGFGWILGELVRRITNKRIERFLEQDVLAPAGLHDLRLGVPAAEIPSLARSYWVDEKPPSLGGEVLGEFEVAQNSPEQLTSVLPGGGTIGTARALCAFYAWLVDGARATDGTPMIREATLSRYVTEAARGTDRVVRVPMVLGRGFALGWFWPHPYGWWRTSACYGHAGNFSTIAWADPTTGCAIAIVTNGNRSATKLVPRCAPIGQGIRAACIA
ncbi:MAG TPA: serine hydrolase domain-containing protein [Polyangiaceae bacterium]|nr:serine hydrolase domain-containing protein [Polyangiaceae bacterium]